MVGNEWEPAEKEHFITRPGQNGGVLLLYATINQSDYAACDPAAPVPAQQIDPTPSVLCDTHSAWFGQK